MATSVQARVSFVVPVFNARSTIEASVRSVLDAAGRWPGTDVVICDNGSTDGTYEFLRQAFGDRVHLCRHPEASISALRNAGVGEASGAVIAFVDADCTVSPDHCRWVAEGLAERSVAATGHPYALPDRPHWIEETWALLHARRSEGHAEWLPGGNLAVRRDAFEEVGGFDPRVGTGEDAELCQRLRRAGYRIAKDPRLHTVHLGNPRTLRAFFKQHWWHGTGAAVGARRGIAIPLAMTIAHLGAAVTAPLVAWGLGMRLAPALLLVLGGQLVVPAAAVMYRVRGGGRVQSPWRAMALYWVYFASRVTALSSVTLGWPRRDRGRR